MADADDDRAATIRVFLTRFDALLAEYHQNSAAVERAQEVIDKANARLDAVRDEAEQLNTAAQLLGFSVYEEHERRAAELVDDLTQELKYDHAEAAEPEASPATPAALNFPRERPAFNMTVREYILREAKNAFPHPVRASSLRRRLHEQYGKEVHEKTFGMTLYRMSREKPPLMRREGRQDWYFVPDPTTQEGREIASRLF